MIEWLTDTLVMTGALMALVLVVRRPVSRWFGPTAAYALWGLPLLRLVLPPLALPHNLFARPEIAQTPIWTAASPAQVASPEIGTGAVSPMMEAAATVPAAADPGLLSQVPWMTLLVAVWLTGAAIFLLQRARNYRLMRRQLLENGRVVAHAGDIRIIETPEAGGPLAFGVRDKVVALPQGFLATVDSESSDFAIAHELEHHAGNDLLALIVLQPLFALHWFNPLGWAAWRALRADQEAACDARVMADCDREMRARYGRVIASFAAGTRLTLAAPIAGALAGEKPIIQRLKALAMLEISPARRVVARSLFAFAVVSVPCTATVTYAAMNEQDVPEVPEPAAPMATPEPPIAPQGDAARPVPPVPEVPAVPEPVVAAEMPQPPEAPRPPRSHAPQVPQVPPAPPAPSVSWAVPPAPPTPPIPPAPPSRGSASFRNAASWDYEARVSEAMRHAPQVEQSISADGKVQTIRVVRRDGSGRREIVQSTTLDSGCPADRKSGSRRGTETRICTGTPKVAMEAAGRAIASARESIAANRNLDASVRHQVIAELDRELAETRAEMAGEGN